jgi:histone deacetylase complex regulatory component SIN3
MALTRYRIDTLGTVEAVIDLLHPFPDLLLAWNTFLPDVWHVQSAPDPKDPYTSLVTVKTPSGEMSLRKKVDDEMYPLIPIKDEMAPILALLDHVKDQRPDVYQKLIKTIQPRPDGPIVKVCLPLCWALSPVLG